MVRKVGKSSSAMHRVTSNGKRYPTEVGKRDIFITYVNRQGETIKITRATTFDRALSRVVQGIKKYNAAGGVIEGPYQSDFAEFELDRRQRSTLIVRFPRASEFHKYLRT